MSIGDMALAAAAQDVIRELKAEKAQMREAGAALLSHLDALMPAIEQAIAAEWKRGNYINGPQFGTALEAFRETINDAPNTPQV